MIDTEVTQHHHTVPLFPLDPHRRAVFKACQEADALPWWALIRRQGWISTARHLKRLHELSFPHD